MTQGQKPITLYELGNRREDMNDIYELQEFLDTPAGAGFVMTRKCGIDLYDSLIDRRLKSLRRKNKPFRLYRNGDDGSRELLLGSNETY